MNKFFWFGYSVLGFGWAATSIAHDGDAARYACALACWILAKQYFDNDNKETAQ